MQFAGEVGRPKARRTPPGNGRPSWF